MKEAAVKLSEMTPAPMNTIVEKQPREEAVQKRIKRRSMEVKDVPPTTLGREIVGDVGRVSQCSAHRKIVWSSMEVSCVYITPKRKLRNQVTSSSSEETSP